MTRTKNTRTRPTRTRERIEWTYTVGPARRSWRWYLAVVMGGLAIAGLLVVASPDDSWPSVTMLLWICAMVSMSLIPRIEYTAAIDGGTLTIQRTGRRQLRTYQLKGFVSFTTTRIPADRVNPEQTIITFRPRSQRQPVDISLTDDAALNRRVLGRMEATVPSVPNPEPSRLEQIETRINRWVGWR